MCWQCKYLYYIDGQARCELDYRELSLADMASDRCIIKGVKKDEQDNEEEIRKTSKEEID